MDGEENAPTRQDMMEPCHDASRPRVSPRSASSEAATAVPQQSTPIVPPSSRSGPLSAENTLNRLDTGLKARPDCENSARVPSLAQLSTPLRITTTDISAGSPLTSRPDSSSESSPEPPSQPRRSRRLEVKEARRTLSPGRFALLYPPSPVSERGSSVELEREEEEEDLVDLTAEEQEEEDPFNDSLEESDEDNDRKTTTPASETTTTDVFVDEPSSDNGSEDGRRGFTESVDVDNMQNSPKVSSDVHEDIDDAPDAASIRPPVSPLRSPSECVSGTVTSPGSRESNSPARSLSQHTSSESAITTPHESRPSDGSSISEGSFQLSAASSWSPLISLQSSDESDESDDGSWRFVFGHTKTKKVSGDTRERLYMATEQTSTCHKPLGAKLVLEDAETTATARPGVTQTRLVSTHAGAKRKRERTRSPVSGKARSIVHRQPAEDSADGRDTTPSVHRHAHGRLADAQTVLLVSLPHQRQAQVHACERGSQNRGSVDAQDGVASSAADSADDSEEEVFRYLKRPRRQSATPDSSRSATPRESGETASPPTSPSAAPLSPKVLGDDSALIQVDGAIFHLSRSCLVENSEYFARLLGGQPSKARDDHRTLTLDAARITTVDGVSAKDFQTTVRALSDIQYA